jgi:hypothetical protein
MFSLYEFFGRPGFARRGLLIVLFLVNLISSLSTGLVFHHKNRHLPAVKLSNNYSSAYFIALASLLLVASALFGIIANLVDNDFIYLVTKFFAPLVGVMSCVAIASPYFQWHDMESEMKNRWNISEAIEARQNFENELNCCRLTDHPYSEKCGSKNQTALLVVCDFDIIEEAKRSRTIVMSEGIGCLVIAILITVSSLIGHREDEAPYQNQTDFPEMETGMVQQNEDLKNTSV